MGTEPGVVVWLSLLTLSQVAQLVFAMLFWQRITHLPNLRDIDLNDKMDRVLQVASSSTVMKNEAIRRHITILLESIEKDPLASERFYIQVQTLRNALTA